jgi:NAD(P)H-dependent FMN reductase
MSSNQGPARIVVLNAGLAPGGQTQILTQAALDGVRHHGGAGKHLDVQDQRILPYGEEGSDGAERIRTGLAQAEGIIICFPVYNFNMNATLKSVIEHCGPALTGKVVGLMATAGGRFGYMSVLSVVQSLMFDLRAWIVPRQVYAVTEDFDEGRIISGDVTRRVDQLAQDTTDMARRLR